MNPIQMPFFPFEIENQVIDLSTYVGDDPEKRRQLDAWRKAIRDQLDLREYSDTARQWYQKAWHEALVFMYDKSFYDFSKGRYRIDEYLDEGEREFGGYDVLLLWQSYPRLGIDRRNQFDFYREMPGGIPGLKGLVDRCHTRGVRVFINYNPWDQATRRETKTDGEALAEIVAAIGADGVFLDTMGTITPEIKEALERVNPAIVFDPEGVPPTSHLQSITGSWLQRGQSPSAQLRPPQVPVIRWIEPRFIYRSIHRTMISKREFLHRHLFYGVGQVIWENVFGFWNPWIAEDRTLQRKIVRILRNHQDAFTDLNWTPFIGTLIPGVFANRWIAGDKTVYTLYNNNDQPVQGPVLKVPLGREYKVYDLLNGNLVDAALLSDSAYLPVSISAKESACLVVLPPGALSPLLPEEPVSLENDYRRRVTLKAHEVKPVSSTEKAPKETPQDKMRLISGGRFAMQVRHNGAPCMEGNCYGSLEDDNYGQCHPTQYFWMEPYFMDQTEVTNAQYKLFLQERRYLPADLTNFLKHWSRKPVIEHQPWLWEIPHNKENHPVVYVDLEDARAYAQWARKRLPREEEWQFAAQGTDGRLWPWGNGPDGYDKRLHQMLWGGVRYYGNRPDLTKCNSHSTDTTPVDRYPSGASPFGVLDMAGNVWEWTESERDDGHTRYALLKGGAFAAVEGSMWYTVSGAQPCDTHEKMLLLYPGLDRCETIGFRCVRDAK